MQVTYILFVGLVLLLVWLVLLVVWSESKHHLLRLWWGLLGPIALFWNSGGNRGLRSLHFQIWLTQIMFTYGRYFQGKKELWAFTSSTFVPSLTSIDFENCPEREKERERPFQRLKNLTMRLWFWPRITGPDRWPSHGGLSKRLSPNFKGLLGSD